MWLVKCCFLLFTATHRGRGDTSQTRFLAHVLTVGLAAGDILVRVGAPTRCSGAGGRAVSVLKEGAWVCEPWEDAVSCFLHLP